MDNISQNVIRIVAEVFKEEEAGIQPTTALDSLKGYDSLERLNLFLRLEAELGAKFSLNQMVEIQTVGDILSALES